MWRAAPGAVVASHLCEQAASLSHEGVTNGARGLVIETPGLWGVSKAAYGHHDVSAKALPYHCMALAGPHRLARTMGVYGAHVLPLNILRSLLPRTRQRPIAAVVFTCIWVKFGHSTTACTELSL